MSDKEINKVHLEAEQDNRHRFDLTLKGEADNAGVRSVGSAADIQVAHKSAIQNINI